MIPILYDNKETNFTSLGLGVLKDATSAIVTEERNGIFELELKYSVDGKLFNELKNDRYIKVDASPNQKDQLFKIIRVDKPIKNEMTVYAEHVSYLSRDVALNPIVSFNGHANSALNTWLNNLIDDTPFSVYSDILTVKRGSWNIEDYQNARNVLGGKSGSILQNYGGEYQFDNYHIMLWNQRGENRGVPIVYGKNIIDLNQEEEINNAYTSIYPYRVYENENGDTFRITLAEKYIDGDYVDNYSHRKIKTVSFDDESITTEQALRDRAIKYVEDNNIGLPKVNIKVDFIDLASTLNYKDRAIIEQIDLCDTLPIIYDKIGIETQAKIVKVTYDVLRDRYETLEFGSIKSNLSQTITETVTQETERLDKKIEHVQISANGKNKVFRSETEPTDGMTKNDLWYKPVGAGETELYRYTGTMWSLEKVSAGLLGGTLDAGAGDLNVINLNANSIVTGALDALLVDVINLTADNITSGTIDANVIGVTNLNANNITSGTIDADMIDATTLSAITADLGTITAGTINSANIYGSYIEGGTIKETGPDTYIELVDDGLFVKTTSGDVPRISIETDINETSNVFEFPALIWFEKTVPDYKFAVGTGASGLGDGFIGFTDPSPASGRVFSLLNSGGTVDLSADKILLNASEIDFLSSRSIKMDEFGNLILPSVFSEYTNWNVQNTSGETSLRVYASTGNVRVDKRADFYDFTLFRENASVLKQLQVGTNLFIDNQLNVTGNTYLYGTVVSEGINNETTSLSSNVRISGGVLYRSTSASKYKTDILPVETDFSRILSIKPKSWYDKADIRRNNGSKDGLWRQHGVVAEDLVDAGLDEFVTWENGEPEGVEYDRLAIYLFPIVKNLLARVDELERVIT